MTAGHEQHADLAPRDSLQAYFAPFLLILGQPDDRVGGILRQGFDTVLAVLIVLLARDSLVVYAVYALDIECIELLEQCVTLWLRKPGPELEKVALAGGIVALADFVVGHGVQRGD